ncbi:DUF302 domain-containing protein [Paeniglutamicibacter terrestris]|uniref:DUF302 domain-containing protein n=1 Tax=Paeniglutamicibacter terrestris TaxID=2723403 RepID=UPI001FD8B4DB|nr:DUF302 domain-containing protein [Paeniglutamicibacter terrestris]
MTYTHAITVPLSWQEAVERTRGALAEQGFGVLTDIDVKGTITQKVGHETEASVGTRSFSEPATRNCPNAATPPNRSWAHCSRAASSHVVARRAPAAMETTIEAIDRKPWSSSARAMRHVRSPTKPMPGFRRH